jgi:diguanylate cyclase (GGDEF)-like protein
VQDFHINLPQPFAMAMTMTMVILATCMNYLVIWVQNRERSALLWMAAASFLTATTFVIRLSWPGSAGVIVANLITLTGLGLVWAGCRVASGRRPVLSALLLPGAIWLLLACIPGFLHATSAHIGAAYLLAAPVLLLALRELWPTAVGHRAGRIFVSALLALFAILGIIWGGLQLISLVHNLGIGAASIALPVSAFTITGFYLVLSFAFVALMKEVSEWSHGQTAFQDALTGLANRRHLDGSLAAAVETAHRVGGVLAAIMIDIDQFKAYNDRYGHPAGDACLRTVAACLRSSLSSEMGEIMRYGGEEFTALIPSADVDEALALAERMRQTVVALRLPHEGWPLGFVTVSLGVAVMEPPYPHPSGVFDGPSLIAAADRALYRAKETGRNCTVLFSPAETSRAAFPDGGARLRYSPLPVQPQSLES